MKEKRQIIIGLVFAVLASLLVGCGAQYDNSYESNNKIYKQFLDDMSKIDMVINDYSFGSELRGVGYDTSIPIATIYVNPFATEELIDIYITAGTQFNNILSENKVYRDFISVNKPFIAFECFGEEIARIDVNSKINNEALKNEMLTNITPYKESIEQELNDFYAQIDMDDFLNKDADGNYYYVLDTKNVSESFGEIRANIDEIKAIYPLEFEDVSKYSSSLQYIGDVFGAYTIYFNEYGEDKLASHWDDEKTTFLFCSDGRVIFNQFYMNIIQNEDKLEGLDVYSELSFGYNNDYISRITISTLDNDAYTKEEYYKAIYDVYVRVYDIYEEYGINEFDNIEVAADRLLAGYESDSLHIVISANVSLDKKYNYDEFVKLLDIESYTYDQGIYEQG